MLRATGLAGLSLETLAKVASLFEIGVVVTDADGRGRFMNERWRAWSGLTPSEWAQTFDRAEQAHVLDSVEHARVSGSAGLQTRIQSRTGDMWVHVRVFRISSDTGAVEALVIGASDITALHHMTTRFEQAALATIESLTAMEAVRDLYTAGHQSRVGRLSEAMGVELRLDEAKLTGLRIAAMLHDVGKVGTPLEILTKPAKLTAGEYAVIKEHATNGYGILAKINGEWPVARVAHEHHERLNGSGYPQGLRGDDILLEARITAVADVVESMAVNRPYRSALGVDVALEEVRTNRGRLYDADAVDACITIMNGGFKLSQAA